jgi:hypothetical protein
VGGVLFDKMDVRGCFLTTNAHTSERNLFGQVRFSELEWWHLGAADVRESRMANHTFEHAQLHPCRRRFD